MKHIALTQKQWNETWNELPNNLRFYDEESDRTKAGFRCFSVGNLLVWWDYLMPEDQWSDEVEAELRKVLADESTRRRVGHA